MYITLYYLVTRLPDSLSSVTNHFVSLCPTELTVDLLEEHLTTAEKSILAVVGDAATARARGARVVEGTAGAAAEAVEEAEGVAVEVGVVSGVAASAAAEAVVEAAAEVVEAAAVVVEAAAAVAEVAVAVVPVEQLHEWYAGRGRLGGAGPCTYVLRTGIRREETCELPHTAQRCFGRLSEAWRAQFPDAVELPCWGDLLRQNVAIFDFDFDAILAAMYALTDIAEGDCYLSVLTDPGIEAAALGASASTAPGTGESAALGAAPDAWVDQFAPGGQRVTHCTCSRTGRHLATFTRRPSSSLYTLTTASLPVVATGQVFSAASGSGPMSAPCSCHPLSHETLLSHHCLGHPSQPCLRGMASCTLVFGIPRCLPPLPPGPGSSLYTLTTAPPPISASGQVAASSHVFAAASRSSPASAPCSCQPLTHETLLWHHRLGHPSLPHLRGMASRTLVLGLPRCLPPLPLGPAPTCVPCGEGRQRAAPHSSSFPPTEAPLQTLHMDVGGEFYSDLLRAFCRAEGIRQTFMLLASPQQNGIAERRIGMVMDINRTSMIHAAAPHFLWPFAVQYAAHQINLQPRVSLLETTPTLRWTGKVGDASAFRVWGSRAFVRDTSADKLSSRAIPCVFLGFPTDAPGWQFYHPTSRRVLSSQDVKFDESVSYYRLFPYRAASLPPPQPLFLVPDTPPVDPLPPEGPAPSGVSQVDPSEPVEVAVNSGAAQGAEPVGAGTGGAEPDRVEPWGSAGAGDTGGAAGTGAAGGVAGAAGGATGAGAAGSAAGAGAARAARGAAGAAGGAAGTGGAGAADPGGARPGGAGAAGAGGTAGAGAAGSEASGVAGVVIGDPGAEGTGVASTVSRGAARPRPYYVLLLQQVLGLPPSPSPTLPSSQPAQSQSQLHPSSPLPGPSPYSRQTRV
ncbi:unnamed protein product [Closterium sp. NIES-53]